MQRKVLYKKHEKAILILLVLLVVAVFMMEPFQASIANTNSNNLVSPGLQPNIYSNDNILSSSSYTNGTYKIGQVGSISGLSIFSGTTASDVMLTQEIYGSALAYFPNETYQPWLATSYNESNVSSLKITTYDPMNGVTEPVKYIYTVHIRPNVKWQDYTSSNSGNTYTFSNHTSFINCAGVAKSHTYKSFYDTMTGKNESWNSISMKTYYVQSADFVLSWKILNGSLLETGSFIHVVNVVPVNNLTVEYYLTAKNTLFPETTLGTDVLPYHIWINHDYASTQALWNYTSSLSASGSYNTWNLGYNPTTGYAPGLVGDGPYMMYGGNGVPKGAWIQSDYWQLYVNPYFFSQNVPSLSQYTPKIYSLKTICYTSASMAVAGLRNGQVDALQGTSSSFIPTIKSIPSTYIYDKAGTGFANQQVNAYSANAPFNITGLREALEYAIPKTYLADVVDQGYSIPGNPSVVPSSDALWHDSSIPYYHFNLQKARSQINATIKETSKLPEKYQLHYNTPDGYYAPGAKLYYGSKPVSVTNQIAVASENPLGVEGAFVIASDWEKLGIPVTVKEEASLTACAATVALSPTDPNTFNVITCGVSGLEGNDAPILRLFYNTNSIGTGFYLGTFTSVKYEGPTVTFMNVIHNTNYTGKQVISLMDNMTNEMYSTSNMTKLHELSNAIQYMAAQEATFENLGYRISPIPITNSTFTGIIKDTLGTSTFWYWNFMSLHLKKPVTPSVPTSIPLSLKVGVITSQRIYYDGQYGNVTIQARDQYGQPMPGITVNIGFSPAGAILNVSSYTGVTGSNGIYKLEFKVSPGNTLIYTPAYSGNITITASASSTSSNIVGGIGEAYINIAPKPVLYKTSSLPLVNSSTDKRFFNITIYNPMTGKPISGYKYEIQALNNALNIYNTSKNQSVSYSQDIGAFGIPLQGIPFNKTALNYNLTIISGVTGSSGNISILMSYNSTFNFTLNGAYYTTYIFVGNYVNQAPVNGKLNYMQLGELTSIYNAYPGFFGEAQPFEIPVMITNKANDNVNIHVITNHSVTYNGITSIMLYATDNGHALSNYSITLTSQNVLGANRGYFVGGSGIGYNPNSFLGSGNMPEISVKTNATGYAKVEFNASLYAPASLGSTVGYRGVNFQPTHFIPYDEFDIGIISHNYTNATYITSTPFIFNNTTNPYLVPYVSVYLNDESSLNNIAVITGGSGYTMYINSTYNNMAGPNYGNIPFTLNVNYGTISKDSGKTNSNGTYSLTYKAPAVKVMTLVTVTIKTGGNSTFTQSFYVIPQTKIVKPDYTYYYIGIGTLAAVAVAFIGLYVNSIRKMKLKK